MISLYDATIDQQSVDITIADRNRNESSGRAKIELNQQVTKTFIKKHFRLTTYRSDSLMISGNLFRRNDQRFLQIELTDRFIGNQVAFKEGIAYKCNFSGEIQRITEIFDAFGTESSSFEPIEENVYGVLARVNEDMREALPGDIEVGKFLLYIPASISGEIGDRLIFGSGEVSKHQELEFQTLDLDNTFEGVKFVTLDFDTR